MSWMLGLLWVSGVGVGELCKHGDCWGGWQTLLHAHGRAGAPEGGLWSTCSPGCWGSGLGVIIGNAAQRWAETLLRSS